MTNKINILFSIDPFPKKRPRVTRKGWAYTDPKNAAYEKDLKVIARSQYGDAPLRGPLEIHIEFYFKRPKKPSNCYPKGDVDNYAKAVMDAMNDLIYKDDSQVCNLQTFKKYAPSGNDSYIRLIVYNIDPLV